MNIVQIHQGNPDYPSALQEYLGNSAPRRLVALGNFDILRHKKLALFCSVKCPGNLILQTHDLAQHLRQAEVTVISGFHSPVEHECLTIILRGTQPVIVCPARGIEGIRIRVEYRKPLEEGRLLFLSPFTGKHRRITVETAVVRNRFVAALADTILIAYTGANGKIERLCRYILQWQKPLYTLENDANTNLIALGAKPVSPDNVGNQSWS